MQLGTKFGAYEVSAKLGEGGMGQVYRATDAKLKRQVAIKVLPPSLATDADRLARFQREAEVLASLNHPNIAAIYGLEESGRSKPRTSRESSDTVTDIIAAVRSRWFVERQGSARDALRQIVSLAHREADRGGAFDELHHQSWFVPTEFEVRDGKPVAVTLNFGPGMESRSAVTAWDPPRMFAAQGEGWGGSPPIADEWSVEARAGGICIVRVVHSLFASTDDWDNQLEGTESGWPGFFRILRIYLTHFRGQGSAMMQWMAPAAGTEAEAWETLTAALGMKGVSAGQHWTAPAGVPALGGLVEHVEHGSQRPCNALLRLDKPGPGAAALGAVDCGGPIMVTLSFYLYGDQAAGTVARETPIWQAWIQERFPMPSEPGKSE